MRIWQASGFSKAIRVLFSEICYRGTCMQQAIDEIQIHARFNSEDRRRVGFCDRTI